MGDRCWFEVWVKNEDVEKFTTLVFGAALKPMATTEHYAYFQDDQAHMGRVDECMDAAAEGLNFFGRHGNGANYGWYAFYTAENELHDYETGHDFIGVVIQPLNMSGDVEVSNLLKKMSHYRVWNKLYENFVENEKWPATI